MLFDSESAREAGKKSSRKGIPNKLPNGVKDKIATLVDKLGEKMEYDLASLSTTERVKAYLSLLEFIEPKKSRVEANVNSNVRNITIGSPKRPDELDDENETGFDRDDNSELGEESSDE